MKNRSTFGLFAAGLALAAPIALFADPADAQLRRRPPPQQPQPLPPPVLILSVPQLQADLNAKAGSDIVRFERDSFTLDMAAQAALDRQALWLRANPMVRVNIEGHADTRQTRSHALALGERRASAVRNFLLTRGIPPEQMTVVSWGRERPATGLVHDAAWLQNSRVQTVVVRATP